MVGLGTTWIEETRAKLDKEMEEIAKLKRQIASMNAAVTVKQDYITALQKVLDYNREKGAINVDGVPAFNSEEIRTQSIKDSLFEIAAKNDGLLVANEAVTILIKAGVFSDRERARNQVYSNLNHYKKYFTKDRPGVYRLIGMNQEILMPLTT